LAFEASVFAPKVRASWLLGVNRNWESAFRRNGIDAGRSPSGSGFWIE